MGSASIEATADGFSGERVPAHGMPITNERRIISAIAIDLRLTFEGVISLCEADRSSNWAR